MCRKRLKIPIPSSAEQVNHDEVLLSKGIPNIIIRKTKALRHYGRLRKAYLEMHRPILLNELVLSDSLFEHCAEIDEAARNRMELIVPELAKRNGVTEQLKGPTGRTFWTRRCCAPAASTGRSTWDGRM